MNSSQSPNTIIASVAKLYTRSIAHNHVAVTPITGVYDKQFELLSLTNDYELTWLPVEAVSRTLPIKTLLIRTCRHREVAVGKDATIRVIAPGGELIGMAPHDSVGHMVPVLKQLPEVIECSSDSPDVGWLIGAFISDGWITSDWVLGFTKDNETIRQHFIALWEKWCSREACVSEYSTLHSAGTDAISGRSTKIHIRPETQKEKDRLDWLWRQCVHHDADDARQDGERTCLFKQLPPGFLTFSRTMKLALLAGLIDGDGSVSLNRSRGKPQVLVSFSTSSPYLAEDVPALLTSLGIKSSVSKTEPQKGRLQTHTSYTISLSTPDLHQQLDDIKIQTAYDGWQYLRDNPPVLDQRDIVPIWSAVAKYLYHELQWIGELAPKKASFATLMSKVRNECGPMARASAEWYLHALDRVTHRNEPKDLTVFRKIVSNHSVGWDRVETVTDGEAQEAFTISNPGSCGCALTNGLIL